MSEPEEILFTSKLPAGDYSPQVVPVDGSLIEGNRFDGEEEKIKPVRVKKLTVKERIFCEEYLIDGNGTRSVIDAGYSETGASVVATRMLAKVSIKAYIQEKMDERSEKTGVTAERVVAEIAKFAFDDGSVNELKPTDRLKALEMLGKHTNIYEKEIKAEAKKEITITYTTEKDK